MRGIFLSYRRDDAEGQAGRLFDDLTQHFGKDAVFMDVATIDPGRDFRRAIDEHVASCGVLLAIIGKSWLTAEDESGARRLDDPADFVRLETASALKRDIPVIPVLVQEARMPRVEDLPEDLRELAFRNAVELTHARWDSDVQVLVRALRSSVQTTQGPTALRPQSTPSKQDQGRTGLSRMIIAVLAGVLVLALGFGGYIWQQKSAGVDAREPAESEKQDRIAAEIEEAKVGQDRISKDEIAPNQTAVQQPKEEAGTQAKNALSFNDWQGSWDLKWEYEGQWTGSQMDLKSHQSGIFGVYTFGTIDGDFTDGDFTKVAGKFINTAGTSVVCPDGKLWGRFLFNLSNGKRLDGWWDLCGEGKKWKWEADKLSE